MRFIDPLENISLIWRRYHYMWRIANFDLCSALTAIEQWGFFSVPHLLWHGASVYSWSSPRTRDTHTFCITNSSGAVITCFYDIGLSRLGLQHPTFRFLDQRSTPTAPPPRFKISEHLILVDIYIVEMQFFTLTDLLFLTLVRFVSLVNGT